MKFFDDNSINDFSEFIFASDNHKRQVINKVQDIFKRHYEGGGYSSLVNDASDLVDILLPLHQAWIAIPTVLNQNYLETCLRNSLFYRFQHLLVEYRIQYNMSEEEQLEYDLVENWVYAKTNSWNR